MLHFIRNHVWEAARTLLPDEMDSPEAEAMLLAIGLQESRFRYRHQRVRTRIGTWVHGPANGFHQFERGGGVKGVLTHPATRDHADRICRFLRYEPKPRVVHKAIAHNDVLATVFARLLLWTHPDPLPGPDEVERAWKYYRECWRPGRPHEETWPKFYAQAHELVSLPYNSGE